MLRRPLRHGRNRRQLDPSNTPDGSTVVATITLSVPNVLMDLSTPCSLKGIPQLLKTGVAPTAAVMLSPTQCRLSYAVAAAIGQSVVLLDRDMALRSYSGGYVAAATETF